MINIFVQFIHWLVKTVMALGYPGIVLLMALESSFFPFPSEAVMIPAGYLAEIGKMNLYLAIAFGLIGSLIGALFNYYISYRLGLPFLRKYGKYFLVSEKALENMEKLFDKHGDIITFTGRLIPGIRQYISLPAGVAKMPVSKFISFTSLGAGIWIVILTLLGYFIGENELLIKQNLHLITYITLVFVVILTIIYIILYKRRER
jgi:membrane protein DedA with SNARE-associated domain